MPQKTTSSSSSPEGAYLLSGEDEFRKRLILDKLKQKLLDKGNDAFNLDLYYGKTSSAEEILCSLETFSMSGNKKLVVLKEPELLSKEDKASLIGYLKRPQPGANILVLFTGECGIQDDRFNKEVGKYAKVFNLAKLQPHETFSWITKELKLRNKSISRKTAELIYETAAGELSQIVLMIEQLSIFTGDREKITDDDLIPFTENKVSQNSTFKLLDSINRKETDYSLRILKDLLRSESNPSQIIGLLSWHITRLISIKKLLIKKASRDEMLSYFKTGNYVLNKLIAQAKNFSLTQLKRHLDALVNTDIMAKRSNVKDEILLEILVVRLST